MAPWADSAAETTASESFRILFVCTGNVCRSAFAERLARAWLSSAGASEVAVLSAGTRAMVGEPMHARSASLLRRRFRAEAGSFAAQQLTADLVAQADLVLGAERSHRAAAVSLHPRSARYAFALREFARLAALVEMDRVADDVGAARARTLVAQAASGRGQLPPQAPCLDAIPDPYGAEDGVHDAALQLLAEVLVEPLALVARAVAGAGNGSPGGT